MLRYLLPENLLPGSRPGALARDTEVIRQHRLVIRHVSYDPAGATEADYQNFDQCPDITASTRLDWLHFQGDAPPSVLARLRDSFGLHPLAVEDVQNIGQRPKLEIFDDCLFVTMALPRRDDTGLRFEQISVFASPQLVLSFHAGGEDLTAPIRQRIQAGKGRIRHAGADYLMYALIDLIVDFDFPLLETYADELDALEEDIFSRPRENPVSSIHRIKSDLIGLRKVLWHQSVMLADIVRAEHPLLVADNLPYYRDAEDHARRVNDLLDGYRDACGSLLDTHLSLSSARLNDTMKVLTVISTIFIPLSFVAGLYGMNFDTDLPGNMPELSLPYAYPVLLGGMLTLAVGMLILFRRRGWL